MGYIFFLKTVAIETPVLSKMAQITFVAAKCGLFPACESEKKTIGRHKRKSLQIKNDRKEEL